MWVGFTFFSSSLAYDVGDPSGVNEPFCNSSVQCLLTFWSTGLFSGGTNDLTGQISYRQSPGYFLGIFFYNFIAFIIINTIFSNIFTGLITDSFGSNREKRKHSDYDKNNLCYICDYSRTTASLQGKSFEKHKNYYLLIP